MELLLQIILIIVTGIFFLYIINMIRLRKLELKYTLLWMFTSVSFIIMAIFPRIIVWIADFLHIKEPVNALFLITLFFLILIIFSLTVAIAVKSRSITTLTQELGIVKMQIVRLDKAVFGNDKRMTAEADKGKGAINE